MAQFTDGLTFNVNKFKEQRQTGDNNLDYLSWSNAWAEAKKMFSDITYEIHPYHSDEYGIMCYSSVTVNGVTYDMWLPVMDGSNKAMKNVAYEYATKYGKKTVQPATMFDINKTYMRCLVKNIAVATGIGLYIYNGDDLPPKQIEDVEEDGLPQFPPKPSRSEMLEKLATIDGAIQKMKDAKKVESEEDLTTEFIEKCYIKKFGN